MIGLKEKFIALDKIPSITHYEYDILQFIELYLRESFERKGYDYKIVHVPSNTTNPGLAIIKGNSPITLLAHVDRILVPQTNIHFRGNYITGQLDNIIGVASIMEVLESPNFTGAVLFTTEEETLSNKHQIHSFITEHRSEEDYIIDVDIDPITTGNTLFTGVSIRDRDSGRTYNPSYLKKVANECHVRYLSLGTWLICQATTIRDLLPKNLTVFTGVPILNYHSSKEIAHYPSVKKLVYLLSNTCRYCEEYPYSNTKKLAKKGV